MDNCADRDGQSGNFRLHWGVLLGGLEGPCTMDIKGAPCEMSNAIKCLLTKPSRRRAAASSKVRLSWSRLECLALFRFVKTPGPALRVQKNTACLCRKYLPQPYRRAAHASPFAGARGCEGFVRRPPSAGRAPH